jgi:predicted O-methyltransferase YrrM
MIKTYIFRILSYVTYLWRSQSNHYLHSPFVFEWYRRIKTPIESSALESIEKYRMSLDQSKEDIEIDEYGVTKKTKISSRYRQTSISRFYGQLIYQTAAYLHANYFLELGTSLAVSTAYLSQAHPNMHGQTIDYQKSAREFASRQFGRMKWDRVEFIEGSFEKVLPEVLSHEHPLDLVFIDGDHSYASTVRNTIAILPFLSSRSVIILDDIRWSPGMYQAWEELKGREEFNLSIDFGRMGLLFHIDRKMVKQDFILN